VATTTLVNALVHGNTRCCPSLSISRLEALAGSITQLERLSQRQLGTRSPLSQPALRLLGLESEPRSPRAHAPQSTAVAGARGYSP
jgi:hypothetical protein